MILSILLALGLISGGIPSAVNAADVQDDYIDPLASVCDQDNLSDPTQEACDQLTAIRDAQAASAVSFSDYPQLAKCSFKSVSQQ